MLWLFKTYALSAGMYASQIYLVYKISGAWQCFQQGWAIRTSDTFNTVNTQYAYDMIPYFMQFGSANFWPKMDPICSKITQNVPNSFPIYMCNQLYNCTGSSLKGRCWDGNCLKKPQNGNKRQILQSYNIGGGRRSKCPEMWLFLMQTIFDQQN